VTVPGGKLLLEEMLAFSVMGASRKAGVGPAVSVTETSGAVTTMERVTGVAAR
jgi:hypothetical protein